MVTDLDAAKAGGCTVHFTVDELEGAEMQLDSSMSKIPKIGKLTNLQDFVS